MFSKIAFFLFFHYTTAAFVNINQNSANITNYGPFIMVYRSIEICSGVKKSNALTSSLSVKLNHIVTMNLTLLKPAYFDELKSSVSSVNVKDNTKHFLWNQVIKKVCHHIIYGPIVRSVFKTESQSCRVAKGTYVFTLDYEEISRLFIGEKFLYGSYYVKVAGISRHTIMLSLCIHCDLVKAS